MTETKTNKIMMDPRPRLHRRSRERAHCSLCRLGGHKMGELHGEPQKRRNAKRTQKENAGQHL